VRSAGGTVGITTDSNVAVVGIVAVVEETVGIGSTGVGGATDSIGISNIIVIVAVSIRCSSNCIIVVAVDSYVAATGRSVGAVVIDKCTSVNNADVMSAVGAGTGVDNV
jgi:hypothetical protein